MSRHRWLSAVLLAAVFGCEGGVVRSEVTEVQFLCAHSEGDVLEVTASLATCLSSSCDKVVDSGCTITPNEDGVLEVSAFATIESRGGTCTTDCGSVSVSCTHEPILPDTYTIRADELVVEYDASVGAEVCEGDEL